MRRSATAFKGLLRPNAHPRRNANFKQIPSALSTLASASASMHVNVNTNACSLTLKGNRILQSQSQSQCKLFSTEADARAQARDEHLQDPEAGDNVLEEVQPTRMRLRDVSVFIYCTYMLIFSLQISALAGCSIATSYGSIFAFLTSFFAPPLTYHVLSIE